MELRKFFLSLLVAGCAVQNLAPVAAHAAAPVGADTGVTAKVQQCGPALKMTSEETEQFMLFNAKLSHLDGLHGKPSFTTSLNKIIEENYPSNQRADSVTPTFFKRLENRVAQEHLRDLIAKTIGLNRPEWQTFDGLMKSITIFRASGSTAPMDKAAMKLVDTLKEAQSRASEKKLDTLVFEETYVSIVEMYANLLEIRTINGEVVDAEIGKFRTVVAGTIFAVAGYTFMSTFKYGGKIVEGSGKLVSRISKHPAIAGKLASLGQIIGGGAVGAMGAPAAHVMFDAYNAVSTAITDSFNNKTTYSCELRKQMSIWSENAAHHTLESLKVGIGFGVAGGAFTVTAASSKLLLRLTWHMVQVAQTYAIAKIGIKSWNAIEMYTLAGEADRAGDAALSEKLLNKSRKFAQEAGNAALESIIIGTLTSHLYHHKQEAFEKGAAEIRKLYATSADTIPTAVEALKNTVRESFTFVQPQLMRLVQ